VEAAPGGDVLAAVTSTLGRAPAGALRPRWDPALVEWRFFRGPRHLLVGRDGWDELALISIGPRRGILLGRVVELRARSAGGLATLLDAASTVLGTAGAHAVSLLTTDPETQAWLADAGWRSLPTPPGMFFFHKDRKTRFAGISLGGGAGDFGMEAFVAE
jgi:hypothetical protein